MAQRLDRDDAANSGGMGHQGQVLLPVLDAVVEDADLEAISELRCASGCKFM